MAESRLNILINAKNSASPQIKQVSNDLKGLDNAASVASRGISALGAAAGIGGILALGSAAEGLARSASYAMMLETSFEGVTQTISANADQMLSAMKRVSRGTIAESELIASANRAILLGVATTTEDMTKLMETALARGRAMGISDAVAFDTLVQGIGKMSALRLDDLGIQTGGERAFDAYAESIGKTSEQLTDAERKQFLLNKAISETVPLIEAQAAAGETLADKFERSDAAFANMKQSLGEVFAPAVASGMENMAFAMDRLRQDIEWLQKQKIVPTDGIDSANASFLNLTQTYLDSTAAIREQQNILPLMVGLRFGDADAAIYQAEAQARSEATANAETAALEELRGAVERLNAARQRLLSSIDSTASGIAMSAADSIGGDAALGLYKDLNKQLVDYNNELLMQNVGESERNFLVGVRGQELREQYRTMYDTTDEIRAQKAATKELNQEFEDLKGKVQGILSGALDSGTGVNPDDFLPRTDAINEDARRLADIAVNGWKSPWVDYFRTEHPALFAEFFSGALDGGDIQAQAAQLLKNFQDGLVPDLIDRDRAKEMVRRMIIGEQNMGALASELAAELAAEMGVSTGAALSAAKSALGVGGGDGSGGVGGEAATAFDSGLAQGLAASNSGGNFVTQLTSQMRASFKLVTSAGTDAGSQFAAGFAAGAANIPAEFINMLVNMITPGVEAALGRRATQTGATP